LSNFFIIYTGLVVARWSRST